jgi:uridine kinase
MSICHKNDKYSLNKGVDIAVRKLLSKIVNIRYQNKMKDFHNMIKDYEKHLKPMKEFIENNKRYISILNKKLN